MQRRSRPSKTEVEEEGEEEKEKEKDTRPVINRKRKLQDLAVESKLRQQSLVDEGKQPPPPPPQQQHRVLQHIGGREKEKEVVADDDDDEDDEVQTRGGEVDIVDILRSRRKLNDSHILDICRLLIENMFPDDHDHLIALIDPGFVALYMQQQPGQQKNARHGDDETCSSSNSSGSNSRIGGGPIPTFMTTATQQQRQQQKNTSVAVDGQTATTGGDTGRSFRRRQCMAAFFVGPSARAITVVPIHTEDHWSLLLYFNEHRTFYGFDSLGAYHRDYMKDFMRTLCDDGILTDTDHTSIVWVPSRRQSMLYECGQYVFMFLYSFLKQVLLVLESRPPLPLGSQRRRHKSCLVLDTKRFDHDLRQYVAERCCEQYRMRFIASLIVWIHEKRQY
jgi:hypothetical protein